MKKKKQHEYADLAWVEKDKRHEAVVILKKGESAPNPTCTTCRLWGPATVTYRRWQDGGIDTYYEKVVET